MDSWYQRFIKWFFDTHVAATVREPTAPDVEVTVPTKAPVRKKPAVQTRAPITAKPVAKKKRGTK